VASLAEVREELAAKREDLHKLYEEAGPELDLGKITRIDGDSQYKAAELKRRMDEINELGVEFDRLALLEEQRKNNDLEYKRLNQPAGGMHFPNGGGDGAPRKVKGLRELLAESKQYKALIRGEAREASIEIPALDFKTLVTLSTISPQNDRRGMVDMALEERTVADLMLQGETDRGTIEYYEETTFTNAAAEVAEGSAKAESAVGFTLRTETVRKIAHWIPATDESLADVPMLESQIRGRLAFGVRRREEQQLLTGDGTAPNISGILDRSGLQTQAKGADPTPDAVYKAMQLVRGSAGAGFAEPTGVIFHPNDWTAIKLLRTTDGIYIWGSPAEEAADRIWGLAVRQTTGMTENTALVGAFRPHAEVLRRTGITVTLSTEHGTYFIENKVAILAEERLALAVYRPSAFCTVTGI
jgi:HK97 family phage major capsid protein